MEVLFADTYAGDSLLGQNIINREEKMKWQT